MKEYSKNIPLVFDLLYHWRRSVVSLVLLNFIPWILFSAIASTVEITPAPGSKKERFNLPGLSIAKENYHNSLGVVTGKDVDHGDMVGGSATVAGDLSQPLLAKVNKYLPYMELGGQKHLNQPSNVAGVWDLFIPLLQKENKLLFTDMRIFDRRGGSLEGNFHLGYRSMLGEEKMFGYYGSYDLRRSNHGVNYRQLVVGAEYWQRRWYFGGNIYQPLGRKRAMIAKGLGSERKVGAITDNKIIVSQTTAKMENIQNSMAGEYGQYRYFENAVGGIDGEVGYAFSEKLTGYVGGYYFHGAMVGSLGGPRIRVSYDYRDCGRKKLLGILDRLGVELGGQHDQRRGFTGYAGLKLGIGLALKKDADLLSFERHMTELVRRDPDIVLEVSREAENFFPKGKISRYFFHETAGNGAERGEEVWRRKLWERELAELLRQFGLAANATAEEVKKRYRELALRHHPDKGGRKKDFIKFGQCRDRIDELFILLGYPASRTVRVFASENNDTAGWGTDGVFDNDFNFTESDAVDCFANGHGVVGDFGNSKLNQVIQILERKITVGPNVSSDQRQPLTNLAHLHTGEVLEKSSRSVNAGAKTNVTNGTYYGVNVAFAENHREKKAATAIKGLARIGNGFLRTFRYVDAWLHGMWRIFFPMALVDARELRNIPGEVDDGIINLTGRQFPRIADAALDSYLSTNLTLKDTVARKNYGEPLCLKREARKIGAIIGNFHRLCYVSHVLASLLVNLNHCAYQLTRKQVDVLDAAINDNNFNLNEQNFAVTLFANYTLKFNLVQSSLDFLLFWAKNNPNVADIFRVIIRGASRDSKAFLGIVNSLVTLLPRTQYPMELTMLLTQIHGFHNYCVTWQALPYFEILLKNTAVTGSTRRELLTLLGNSLEKILLSGDTEICLDRLAKSVTIFSQHLDDLPKNLIAAIFQIYGVQWRYFTEIVIDILLSDNGISPAILRLLIDARKPLIGVQNPRAALFIARCLVKNDLRLPTVTLLHFLKLFRHGDMPLAIQIMELFYQMRQSLTREVSVLLGDTLIKLFPHFRGLQRLKVEGILKGIELSEKQRRNLDLQREMAKWHDANDGEQKREIMAKLHTLGKGYARWELQLLLRPIL